MAADLQERKLKNILSSGVDTVATANPGCHLQLVDGARRAGRPIEVVHPISLLARAYRAEKVGDGAA
jgi:glycolate oxidase iron-sulfur subunit